MICEMQNAHPHWRRSAIVASIGLLIATGSIVWVGLVVRTVGPKTLSLAYRMNAETTLAFVRSPNRTTFERRLRTLSMLMRSNDTLPTIATLPDGLSYEYGLIDTGSGTTVWVIGIRKKNQADQWIVETASPPPLLPTQRIKESLGASSFFRKHEGLSRSTVSFINLQRLNQTLIGSEADLIGAIVSPYDAMMTLEQNDAVQTVLRKRTASPFTNNRALTDRSPQGTSLLTVTMGHPPSLFDALNAILKEKSPAIQEGLGGMAKSMLERLTHRSDLKNAIATLLSKDGVLAIERGEDGKKLLLVGGTAASNDSLSAWLQAADSKNTPAVVRTQKFLYGDSRTDVIAAPTKLAENMQNGWSLRRIGSGTALDLAIASKGTFVMVTNDLAFLQEEIARHESAMSGGGTNRRGLMAGDLNIAWLIAILDAYEETARFAPLVQSIAGTTVQNLHWKAVDGRESLTLEFRRPETNE